MKTFTIQRPGLILYSLICFVCISWGQSPDTSGTGFKQLKEMAVKKVPDDRGGYARYCASCHGIEGNGDGLNAYNLKIRPRDFTDTTAMRGKTPAWIRKVIWTGGAANNLSIDMPMWGKTLDTAFVDGLAQYVWWLSKKR